MADFQIPIPRPEAPPTLEADIQRLSREVNRLKNLPEHEGKSNQELLRQSIVNYSASAAATTPPAKTADRDDKNPLPSYAKDIPSAMKLEVEHLLEKAFTEGVDKATREAAQTNPYIMDVFHDALTTHLYPELKKRGFLD
jgi:hypothetical protein